MALIDTEFHNAQQEISVDEIKTSAGLPPQFENDAAFRLVIQDTETTEAWLQQTYWSLKWREADALYQSPPSILMWEGTTQPRANVNRFLVAETVQSILPQVMNGLFYEQPSFILRPQPNLTQNTIRAISTVMSQQMTDIKFRQEVMWGLFSALNFGTAIWKYGFKTEKKKVKRYVVQGSPIKLSTGIPGEQPIEIPTMDSDIYVRKMEEKTIHTPTFENKDIRFTLVSPSCNVPDIQRAGFVIDRMYMTYNDLIKLKDEMYIVEDDDGNQTLKRRYDLPSEETIKQWFAPPKEVAEGPNATEAFPQPTTAVHHAEWKYVSTTADPLEQPLEVLERWDNGKVITVLQRKKVIRNEQNEFDAIPYLSCNWWDIPGAFWGLGLGRIIGVEQRVQAGLINACLDLANLIVNPMYVVAQGANVQTQQIRQRIGGIIQVQGEPGKAFQQLESPKLPAEIVAQIGLSQQRVEHTSGANEQLTMGAAPTGPKSSLGRSGTGAAGIIQATMNRIGGFAEAFVRQVMEPFLYKMHDMNRDKLPAVYIRELLGNKLGEQFMFSMSEFLNADAQFEVLAGSHLATKAQMAQSLFMMIQLFESAPLMKQLSDIAQKKINVEELFHMVHDLSGFKNYYDIVQDMTPEEKQRADAMNNPAMAAQAKLAGQSQLQGQKLQGQKEIIDQENEARIARDVLRQTMEKATEPDIFYGAPDAAGGFGSMEQG